MPTNLTGQTIASTYDQLLHLDGGPEAAEKVVYSGTGVATALKVGTQSVSVDNIQLDGNTIQALTGNLTLGSSIAFGSASNARTALGLGTIATQNSSSVTITGGAISGVTFSGSFSGITAIDSATFTTSDTASGLTITQDTITADGSDADITITISPKGTGRTNVGGLSATSPRFTTSIDDINGNELLKVTATASAVNEVTLANAATGNGPTLSATGGDTNVSLNIVPKASGNVVITRLAATNPQFLSSILDSNSADLLTLTATASAVNELAIANAATGNGPTLSATGDDTNIDINITPKGTGEVNVTNIDVISGKVPFNVITNRAYAAFSDITDQTGSTTAATAVKFGTTEVTGAGITMVTDGSNLTRLTFAVAGTYMVAPNLQFANSDTADHLVTIWLALDGANVVRSATKISVPKATDGGTTFFQIALYITVTAGQYVQVLWLPANVAVTLDHTAAAAGPPAVPAIPSAIIVAERIA
jgi:hypothetical protein